MNDRLTVRVEHTSSGFYVTFECDDKATKRYSVTTYGPLSADECLQVLADGPVSWVAATLQGELF